MNLKTIESKKKNKIKKGEILRQQSEYGEKIVIFFLAHQSKISFYDYIK